MTDLRFDVAVVGLGLVGAGALRSLADAGVSCIGVGPAEPLVAANHTGVFASHYDSGRITRHLDPVYEWAELAARSIRGYASLQERSGITFHRGVGAVLAELDPQRSADIAAVAGRLDVTTSTFGPDQLDRYDDRLVFPTGSTLTAETAPAGHVDPRRMLQANLVVARQAGASVRREEVSAVEPSGDGWSVLADGGAIRAGRLLVATGPHTDELSGLDGCPRFAVRGETIVTASIGRAEQERLGTLPSVLARLPDPTYEDLYLVPPTDYPDGSVRLKLGATLREPRPLDDAASRRAWMSGDGHRSEADHLRSFLDALVPGLVAEEWETKPCLITDTPSGLPVVDHLAPGLVVAAGGNGYAAKSANAIGALAARLVTDGRWTDPALDAGRFAATGPPPPDPGIVAPCAS